MKQPEARFKQKLIAGFKSITGLDGWHTYIVTRGIQKFGMPDLFFSWRGKTVWIEMKYADNPLSGVQSRTIEQMAKTGCTIWVMRVKPQLLFKRQIPCFSGVRYAHDTWTTSKHHTITGVPVAGAKTLEFWERILC